jgi:hypothetical protein
MVKINCQLSQLVKCDILLFCLCIHIYICIYSLINTHFILSTNGLVYQHLIQKLRNQHP